MTPEILDEFTAELRRTIPGLEIRFKEESWVQRMIGVLVCPFNAEYVTRFTSVFGNKVYFNSRETYFKKPRRAFITVAHEFVHMYDAKKDPLFRLKYLFPQCLAIIPLVVYAVLAWSASWVLLIPVVSYILGACLVRKSRAAFIAIVAAGLLLTIGLGWVLTGWKILVLVGLVACAPWPAPWRKQYELRGYAMTVSTVQWIDGKVEDTNFENIVKEFVGPTYYYMAKASEAETVRRFLEATRQQAQVGALQRAAPYDIVHDFLYARQRWIKKT